MIIRYRGNTVNIVIDPGDSSIVELLESYCFEQIHITSIVNIWGIYESAVAPDEVLIFPPVKSKSPYILWLQVGNPSERAEIRFVIEKFGQIPDSHYFDTDFEPILVTGDDGNEYKVIPSDQFK